MRIAVSLKAIDGAHLVALTAVSIRRADRCLAEAQILLVRLDALDVSIRRADRCLAEAACFGGVLCAKPLFQSAVRIAVSLKVPTHRYEYL